EALGIPVHLPQRKLIPLGVAVGGGELTTGYQVEEAAVLRGDRGQSGHWMPRGVPGAAVCGM
ncbi:MAG TPA: hypothetical protein VNM48_08590, partial [Chloroflexota bacterium]|nr:hypothetical protein [Chloroflexota bacterium]